VRRVSASPGGASLAIPRWARAALAVLAFLLLIIISAALADAVGAKPHQGVPATVHIRGTAYTFENQQPITGATIRVAELPGISTTSQSDGFYDLVVPDGTKVTPYVDAPGHHRIHLQTFVTVGEDLERVNFQVPTEPIYFALAALLGAELDANGDLVRCAIVSTFANVNVRELSFPDFVAFGAHGVAGATATATPALPDPVYFNEAVIPDPSLTESSIDGGVIWIEVPEGVYRVQGHHPTERFVDFIATCEPGRIVNANPPQGLYQLRPGESIDREVEAEVRSAKLKRTGRGGDALRVRVDADEYVAVGAELLQDGQRLIEIAAGDGAGAYAPGRRTLSLPIPAVPPGALELRVTLEDGAGNREVVREQLRLPQAGTGKRHVVPSDMG
jgi:hypothetical protein